LKSVTTILDSLRRASGAFPARHDARPGAFDDQPREVDVKKFFFATVLSCLIAGPASAQTIRDNCGCGLGTMVLEGQEPTLLLQLVATFLNGISGNQTFGITSGTSECDQPDRIVSNEKVIQYVSDNMDHLAMDMARGHGDSLDALADLMNVKQENRESVYVLLQSHFDRIFTSEHVTAHEVVDHITAITQG
jgi:hypothetical protein